MGSDQKAILMELSTIDYEGAQDASKKLSHAKRLKACFFEAGTIPFSAILQCNGTHFPAVKQQHASNAFKSRPLHKLRPSQREALEATLDCEIEPMVRAFTVDIVQCPKTMHGEALPADLG